MLSHSLYLASMFFRCIYQLLFFKGESVSNTKGPSGEVTFKTIVPNLIHIIKYYYKNKNPYTRNNKKSDKWSGNFFATNKL